ncbi:MAG: hypothetical protein KAI83_20060 [Thiomargarita sp.]|nr:hypothetical protein [Thiomargarita sp.]
MSDENTLNQEQATDAEDPLNQASATTVLDENDHQENGETATSVLTGTSVEQEPDSPDAPIEPQNSTLSQGKTANAGETILNPKNTVASEETQENGEPANFGSTDTSVKQKTDNQNAVITSQLNASSIGEVKQFYGKETIFEDPTTIVPEMDSDLPNVNLHEELTKHFDKLEKERIILIDCLEENIALAASYAIADRTELKDYEKRLLTFSGENRHRTDLHVDIFTNEKIKTASRKKLLVFVSLNLDSQGFFDSMFIKDRLDVNRIKQTFRENHIMLVCIVNSDFIREILKTEQTKFCFSYWNIWFLSPLLRTYFFDESRIEYFEKRLSEQRKDGLWPKNNADFYKLVHSYLRNNVEQFREEIEKRTKYCEGDDVNAFLQSLKTVKPSELLQDENSIKKAVLYVATFFSDLSPHDFEQMVFLLLRGIKTTVYKESRQETTNDGTNTVKTPVEKNLVEIWGDTSHQLLKECYLNIISSEKDSLIIDFSEPYLRGELKRYFKTEDFFYTLRQFERFRDAGLLFDFDVSDKVIENFITLSAEMAVSDPNYYGGDRLVNIVVGLEEQLFTDKKREIIIRLSDFIREMLNHPQLKETIRDFLEKLMRTQHHDLVLIVVLGVTKRLQFTSQFDALYWIKRLLDQGQKEVREQTYEVLFEYARRTGFRIYELLETLKVWLPEIDRNVKKYSLSNQYTVQFLVGYCGYMLARLDMNEYGLWPSKYPLFATLQKDDDESVNKLKLLVYWIFHPGMQDVLNKRLIDEGIIGLSVDANGFRAGLIDFWFTVLYGLKKDTVHPEALAISEMLLQQIQQVISETYDSKEGKRIKKELIKHLQIRRNMCSAEIERTKERTQKAQLKFKRQLLSILKSKIKAFA